VVVGIAFKLFQLHVFVHFATVTIFPNSRTFPLLKNFVFIEMLSSGFNQVGAVFLYIATAYYYIVRTRPICHFTDLYWVL